MQTVRTPRSDGLADDVWGAAGTSWWIMNRDPCLEVWRLEWSSSRIAVACIPMEEVPRPRATDAMRVGASRRRSERLERVQWEVAGLWLGLIRSGDVDVAPISSIRGELGAEPLDFRACQLERESRPLSVNTPECLGSR